MKDHVRPTCWASVTPRVISWRSKLILLIGTLVAALVASGYTVGTPVAKAATGPICDQFGSTTQENYTIMNNRWGTSATQCINVTSNGFQITRQDGVSTGGPPVSYPAIYIGCHYSSCSPNTNLPKQISTIGSADTSVSVSYPGSGVYDAAYDIWLNADTNVSDVQDTEIMIWLNHTGSIQPVGSNTGATFTSGGRSWAVWTGWNGSNNVVSYVSSGMSSWSADLKPFLLDAVNRGSGYGNTSWYLTSIQMGFEPWQGGVGLAVNSFSASVSSGSSTTFPTGWIMLANQNSGKCIDNANWGTSNGSVLQQWDCGNAPANQQWQFQATDSGYYKVVSRHAPGLAWDVANWGTSNGSKLQLWSYGGGNNQQWQPISLGGGNYKFVARNSGKCLDVPGAATWNGAQLQIWDCNGTGAQAFRPIQ